MNLIKNKYFSILFTAILLIISVFTYWRGNSVISFIAPLIYFLFANGFLVLISKQKFGKCLPLLMMLNTFICFFSQILFKTFKIGYVINILMAVFFIIIMIYSLLKKENINDFKNNYFSKGLYAFLIIYLIVFIYDFNRVFSHWDEFSHWGVMVKEMMRLDRFYSIKESTLMSHKDYPPIIQIFELFYATISGGYKESYLISGLHLLSFSMFIPTISEIDYPFSKIKCKHKKVLMLLKGSLITFTILLIILFFDQHGVINTIYTDYIMAIVSAYSLFIAISEEDFNLFSNINFIVVFSFLIMIKQMSFVLYLMSLFVIVGNVIFNYKKIKLKKILTIVLLLILIPTSLWKCWNNYVSTLDKSQKQFVLSDLKVYELPGILNKTSGKEYQQISAQNYINTIQTYNLTTNSSIQLSYFQCLIMCLLLLTIVFWYGKKYLDSKKFILMTITTIIGFIGYGFVMLVMYVFSFGEREGPILASFNRYIPTFVILILCFIYMIFIHINSREERKTISIRIAFIIFCSLVIISSSKKLLDLKPILRKSAITTYQEHANNILNKINGNAKILLIAQNTSGEYQFYVKYYMDTCILNKQYFNFTTNGSISPSQYVDEMKKYASNYDYLYLATIDDKFKEQYSFMFDNQDIKVGDLYKIVNQKGKLTLEIVD